MTKAQRTAAILRTQPEIGVLIRAGKPVYYIVRHGRTIEHSDPAFLPL